MRRTLTVLLAALIGLFLTACSTQEKPAADPADAGGVSITDGWVRATVGSQDTSMTGAFMHITNNGDAAVTLTGASTDTAKMAQLHTMTMQDGAMVMTEVDGGFAIKAGETLALQPGGDHVMLMGLTEDLAPGDEVGLKLEFDDGSTEELTLPVKEFTEEEGHYHPSTSPSPSM